MALTLTPAELQELTGYKNGSSQRRWILAQLGITPAIGADGRPRLTRDVVNNAMLARRQGVEPGQAAAQTAQPVWKKRA